MASIQQRECVCGRRYEILRHPQGDTNLDRDDIDDLSCPACGSLEHVVKIGAGTTAGRWRSYPCYDENLQMQLESHDHWLRAMKERNLEPLEPQEIENIIQRQRNRAADDEASYREYTREMADDPDYQMMQDRLRGARSPEEAQARMGRR